MLCHLQAIDVFLLDAKQSLSVRPQTVEEIGEVNQRHTELSRKKPEVCTCVCGEVGGGGEGGEEEEEECTVVCVCVCVGGGGGGGAIGRYSGLLYHTSPSSLFYMHCFPILSTFPSSS